MPRKKVTEDVQSDTPAPKRTTRKKPELEAATEAPTPKTRARKTAAAPEPEPIPEAKPTRSRTKKAEEPAAETKSTTRAQKPKPADPEPVFEFRAVQESPKAEAPEMPTRGRAKKAAAKPEEAAASGAKKRELGRLPIEGEEDLIVTFRPRQQAPVAKDDDRPRNKGQRERSPREQAAPETSRIQEPEIFEIDGEQLVVMEWRSKGNKADVQPRMNNRKSKKRGTPDVTAAEALGMPVQPREPRPRREREAKIDPPKPAPEPEPELPKKPVREPIHIPEDAPQILTRDGIQLIVKGHDVIPPIFFFGAAMDEGRLSNVLEQIRLASENGIHAYVLYLDLEVNPRAVDNSVGFAGYVLKKVIEVDPAAQVLFRVVFTAPPGWDDAYPQARGFTAEGSLADPSLSDDAFWEVAEDCLESFIKKVRGLDTASHVLGVHLDRGEWFTPDGWGYDTSKAGLEKFREWLRLRYGNEVVALRAGWYDGSVTFENVTIPPFSAIKSNEDFVFSGRKTRRWVDYHLFLSDVSVERIGKLAYRAKKASDGYFLVGVSYGYTFEWNHAASGHLSLGKLLRTAEVDFIAGPPSYKSREPGKSCPFPAPIDSFALNGKLYISEEDFKTPISGQQEPDDFNPVIRTPQALESAQWRGAGSALAHGSGICWMDLWGNGWLNTPGIWHRGGMTRNALTHRSAIPMSDPDVAVFIDERSLAYLADPRAFDLLVQNVRESVLRSGLSAGFYLLSDLAHREKFPDCKLYVFMNAWDMRPEVRNAIRGRLQRDGKVLFWLYAAGLFDSGRDSLERVREVTGIALKPQPFASKSGTTLLNRRHPLAEALPEKWLSTGSQLEPSFFAIPEDSVVLGEYSRTGLPSFVVKEHYHPDDREQNWTSVFLGEPVVTPGLFRALASMAGVQAWNYNDDVIHVRPPFLTIHCTNAGTRSLTLPEKWAAYDVLHSHWVATDSTHLRFNALDGSTHVFFVGPKSEIEPLTEPPSADLLHLKERPARPENTVDQDSLTFDVPIMKLDEWMEEGWSEEMADDLLLKPSQLEIDLPEEIQKLDNKTTAHRRRRRKRGGTQNGKAVPSIEELEVNVMFRKRE